MNIRIQNKKILVVLLIALTSFQVACAPFEAAQYQTLPLSSQNEPDSSEEGLVYQEPTDMGYKDKGLACTQRIDIMIDLERGVCVVAPDGCIIDFLQELGFDSDDFQFCAEAKLAH